MESVGERILKIRKENGLTSKEFADKVMCDKRTIQRYENGDSFPDVYNLTRMSMEFNVSTDYILGLSNKKEISYQPEDVTLLYQKYKEMMKNPIQESENYYWIKMEVGNDKKYITSLQTEWKNFIEIDGHKKEVREARKIIPEKARMICEKLDIKPIVINKISEIGLFYLFGGEAFIREELCKEHMQNILQPIIVD